MALRTSRVMQGIMVPTRRMSAIEAVDADDIPGLDLVQTTATQADGRGGLLISQDTPASAAEWVVSGAQSLSMDLEVVDAGAPPATWPTVQWTTLGEASNTYARGRVPPAVLSGYTVGRVETGATIFAAKQICRLPRTEVIALFSGASTSAAARRFVPGSWSWEAADTVTDNPANTVVACCALDDLRVLYLSASLGAIQETFTWIGYDDSSLELRGHYTISGFTAYDRYSLAYHEQTETLILVGSDAATGTIGTAVSRDLGASWQVVEQTAALGKSAEVCAAPNGEIHIVYSRDSDDFVCVRTLATPTSLFSEADEVEIAGLASDEVAGAVDHGTGHLYACYRGNATDSRIRVKVSTDRGATWTIVGDPAYSTQDAGNIITDMSACYAAGRLWVAMNVARTPGVQDGSVVLVALGGQTNAEPGASLGTGGWPDSATSGIMYVPLDLPTDMGWTVAGTAPTISTTDGLLVVSTAAATSTNEIVVTPSAIGVWAHVALRVVSGGSVAADDVSFAIRAIEAVTPSDTQVNIRLSTTQFRVRDPVAGTTLLTVDFDTSTVPVEFLVYVSLTATPTWVVEVWYRVQGTCRWETTDVLALTRNLAGVATDNRMQWGHRAATTSVSHWSVVQFGEDSVDREGIPIGPWPTALVDLQPPVQPPTDPASLGYLSLRAGPALIGETWEGRPSYRYGLDRAILSRTPTLGEWRSTDTSQQLIVWDLGNEGPLGHPMALYIAGANFRQCNLEYYDGAAWQSVGTMDLAYATGISWDAEGEAVFPVSGGATASRSLRANEAVGWTFATGTGGSDTAHKIRSNSPGLWGPTASISVRPRLRVEGEPSTAGGSTGMIIASTGVLVAHLTSAVVARYWRIKIGASQITPDGYYKASVLAVGPIRVLGDHSDEGWRRGRSTGVMPGGQVRTRPLRSITWSWADGLDLRAVRAGTGDHIGPASGLASVTWQDVEGQLSGILDELHYDQDSGELAGSDLPVLAIASIPTATGTVIDPTLMVWGEASISVSSSGASGVEGVDEVVRVDAITVTELP